jgi:hypothetical protein
MITGTIDEVMIKEMTNRGIDMVFIVRNLPKRLIYQEVPKMVQRIDRDGYSDGTLVVDPKGERVEALLDGLEVSRNGDGSIVFNSKRDVCRMAIEAIDQFIAGTLPRDVVVPKRVPYPSQPGDGRSGTIPKHMIPAIDLPKPIERVVAEEISPAGNAASPKPSRVLTPEQKAARVEILRKAREAKAQKEAAAKIEPQA